VHFSEYWNENVGMHSVHILLWSKGPSQLALHVLHSQWPLRFADYRIQAVLDRNHHMTECDIHDKQLPHSIGLKWKDLVWALGYSQTVINTIEKENSISTKECRIELLVRWLRQEGRDAATGKLAEALTRTNPKNLVDNLIESNDSTQEVSRIKPNVGRT